MRRPSEGLPRAGEFVLVGPDFDPGRWTIRQVRTERPLTTVASVPPGCIVVTNDDGECFTVLRVGSPGELRQFRDDLAEKMATAVTDVKCARARLRRVEGGAWEALATYLSTADHPELSPAFSKARAPRLECGEDVVDSVFEDFG